MMKIAAVLMLKLPVPGRVKTRLAKDLGSEIAAGIYTALVAQQLASIPPEWTVECHIDPPDDLSQAEAWLGDGYSLFPQVSGDLGARMSAAAQGAFSRGADGVILLGGDCPELKQAVLLQAAEQLRTHEVVIYPARDGGYVLLGLQRADVPLFHDIPWSTDQVMPITAQRLNDQGASWLEGPVFEDIDDVASWRRAVQARTNEAT